jgi:DNA polymerase III epsilon subunit family exonuclease
MLYDVERCGGVAIVAFDLETTGLSPLNGHRVIEIGAVRVDGGRPGEKFHALIDAGRSVPEQACQIHGITEAMLKKGLTPKRAFMDFRDFIGNRGLVAHNAQFDKFFLQYEISRFGWGLSNRVQCTMRLSREKLPDLPNYRLETVARHLLGETTIENRTAHRALDDAHLTAEIWLALEAR